MEDVSLKYLDPLAYREIEDDLASRSNSSKQFIEDTKALIRSRVEVSIPDVYIEGRVKSVYGIYRKMFIQGKAFDEILRRVRRARHCGHHRGLLQRAGHHPRYVPALAQPV